MIRYNSELAYYNITGEGLVRAGGANVGPQVGIILTIVKTIVIIILLLTIIIIISTCGTIFILRRYSP